MKKNVIVITVVLWLTGIVAAWLFIPSSAGVLTIILTALGVAVGLLENFAKIATYFRGDDKRDEVFFQKRSSLPKDLEILPLSFTIYTNQTPPSIEVWSYLVNHQSKKRSFRTLQIMYFNVSGIGESIENIEMVHNSDQFLPHKSEQIVFRRKLEDSVAAYIKKASQGKENPFYADFALVIHEFSGRRVQLYSAPGFHVKGYIS